MNVMLNKLIGKVETLKLQNVRQSTIDIFLFFFYPHDSFRQKSPKLYIADTSLERTLFPGTVGVRYKEV